MQIQLKATELGWPQDIPGFGTFLTSLHIPDATPEQARSFNELLRRTTTVDNAVALLRTLVKSTCMIFCRRSAALRLSCMRGKVRFFRSTMVAQSQALIPDARFVPLESRNHILLDTEPGWDAVHPRDRRIPSRFS